MIELTPYEVQNVVGTAVFWVALSTLLIGKASAELARWVDR